MIVLRATDGEQNAGVKQIRYMIDATPMNPFTDGNVYTGPIDITTDAPHFITHWSIDNAGHAGAYKTSSDAHRHDAAMSSTRCTRTRRCGCG